MAHADWLPIGPIKSVLTGQYAFSIPMLDRSNKNVREWFVLNQEKMLSDSEEHSPIGNSTTLAKQAIKVLRFLAKRSFTRPPDSRTKNTSCQIFCSTKMPYNKLLSNLACSVCTKKYQTLVFCTDLALRARSVQKDLGLIFLCTDLVLG